MGSGGGVDGIDTGADDGTTNLQQVVRRAVVLRGRVGNQGMAGHGRGPMTFPTQESLRPAGPVAPSNTGRSCPMSDGSILPLLHPRLLAQLHGWPVDEVRRSSFQRRRFELFSRAVKGLNAMARYSDFSDSPTNKVWLFAACLWLMPDLTFSK